MKKIIPIILLIISLAIAYLYILPTYSDIQNLSSDKAEYERAIQTSVEIQNTLIDLQEKYNSFRDEDLHKLDILLPQEVLPVRLIMELNNIASDNSLALSEVQVADSVSEEGGEENTSSQEGLQVFDIGFSVETTYEGFLSFLNNLEESLPFYDIASLGFSVQTGAGEEDEEVTSSDLYSYSIIVRTYYFK